MRKKVLFVGYGIDKDRKEAVSVSTIKLKEFLISLGISSEIFNIGYPSMFNALIKRKSVIQNISSYISKNKITHIHDVFVLPISSLIFTLPLKKLHPELVFIKEIQNEAGFSKKIHKETFIRLLANNKYQLRKIAKEFDKIITKSPYLARTKKVCYLPQIVSVYSKKKKKNIRTLSLCYLGHPLKKKGIYEFPKLFSLLPEEIKKRVEFNFALSDVGPREKIKKILRKSAEKNSIKISLGDIVEPHVFFRKNDVYILPIHDEFGAASLPNTVLEAMEAGALVLATRIKLFKGSLIHQKNALLMPSYRAEQITKEITYILKNLKKLETITKRAREYVVKNHSDKLIRKEIKKIYG